MTDNISIRPEVLSVKYTKDKIMKTLKNIRVLYAEDHEDTCFMVSTVLQLANIDVTIARTIAEGSRLGLAEQFDLYLLDSRFIDGSGLDLCRTLHEYAPNTPILFYSGDAYAADIQKGFEAGATDYLIKPYLEDLAVTVFEAVEQGKTSLVRNNEIFLSGPQKLDKTPVQIESFVWTPQTSYSLIKDF